MFQSVFLWTTFHARANTAMLFFALAMIALFNDKIDPLKKRILFIVFMASCMVSHYSTTYIFFFVMLGTFSGMEILSKRYTFKKVISLTIVILFFALIFFWYSQVTETAFNAGVGFIENTFKNLHGFFVLESRGAGEALLGKDIMQKRIPHKIEFVFTWLTFVFTGVGIITLIRRYKEMSFPELKFKKPDFLKEKFEVEYFVIALACAGLLVVVVALPFVAVGYGLDRMYPLAITILSVFFVIGGMMLWKYLNRAFAVLRARSKALMEHFLSKETFMTHGDTHEHENNKVFSYQRTCAKKETLFAKQKAFTEKRYRSSFDFLSKKRFGENGSQVWAYLVILLVLIPYFLSVSGVTYQMFGYQRTIILNSEGEPYDHLYIQDHHSYGLRWFGNYVKNQKIYYVSGVTTGSPVSQGMIPEGLLRSASFDKLGRIDVYIYVSYYHGKTELIITKHSDTFAGKNNIYDNGGSEVWK